MPLYTLTEYFVLTIKRMKYDFWKIKKYKKSKTWNFTKTLEVTSQVSSELLKLFINCYFPDNQNKLA